jgi:tRNA (cmo5U34)-methyltransferase
METPPVNLWSTQGHALDYLRRADSIPHRTEGETALLEAVPLDVHSILDLGSGDGRLLRLLRVDRPAARCIAIDFSSTMLDALRRNFAGDHSLNVIEHNLEQPLPVRGPFDAVVSSFAIHHLPHERKRSLYAEVFEVLAPGGVLCNLEHVSSPTAALHEIFLSKLLNARQQEDPSNKLLDCETQLRWLNDIGFTDVDCYWKWLELALLAGRKPASL